MDVEVTQEDREVSAPFLALGYANSVELGVFDHNELVQAFARHRSTAHATGFAECREMAAEVANCGYRGDIAQAIRALKPSTDPAKEGGEHG